MSKPEMKPAPPLRPMSPLTRRYYEAMQTTLGVVRRPIRRTPKARLLSSSMLAPLRGQSRGGLSETLLATMADPW